MSDKKITSLHTLLLKSLEKKYLTSHAYESLSQEEKNKRLEYAKSLLRKEA